ncbi:MAG: peptide chain release factor N(5)-glutamine methyltransferase [Microlunatus sp.]|nr:peptide chain release factor N(5)-glutamine methyltransferase [Microlunatus sp.]
MIAGTLLADATRRLTEAGVPNPDHDARELLEFVLGTRLRPWSAGAEVTPADARRFDDLVTRRVERVPLQHLTGVAYFRHLTLAVGPGVFVPRPETEVMTGWAIEALGRRATRCRRRQIVVDLGTGSGAIAWSIATEMPSARVYAVELSAEALRWAERNLAGTDVSLQFGDMADALPELANRVDLVIANPPYVPLEAYASVAVEAREHDPTLALFSGQDGLDAIRSLVSTGARLLRQGGVLTFEHAEVQSESAQAVVVGSGCFGLVRDHHDLTRRPRFVTALRNARPLAGWTK